jgi:hypothetical protein
MPLSDTSSKTHTFNLDGDTLRFQKVRDKNAHITITGEPDAKIICDNQLKAHEGFQADDFESKDGVNLFRYNSGTSRIVFESNCDFSGVSVSGISGGGGGGGTITTQDVDSMNFPGQTLENELDTMTANTLANTNRLTGLPVFRILASDIFGNAQPSSVTIDSVAIRTATNLFTNNNFFLSTNGVGFGTIDYLGTKWAKIDALTEQQIELRGDTNPEIIVGDGTNSIKLLLDTSNSKNKIETTRTLEINNSINLPTGSSYNIGGFPIDTTDLDNGSNIPLLDASLNTFTGNIKGASITATTGFTIDNSATQAGAVTIIANDIGNNRVNFTHFGGGVYNFIGQLHTNGSQIALADLSDGSTVLTTTANNVFTGNNTFRTGTTFQASGSSDSSTILNNGIITLLRATGAEINLDGINIGHTASSLKVNNGGMDIASGNTYKIDGTQIASSDLSDSATLAKLASSNTFTGSNTFQNAFTVQAQGSADITTVQNNGVIVLANGINSAVIFNSKQLRDYGSGLEVVGGSFNIPTGSTYRINDVQISTADLSDGASILIASANNTFTGNNTFRTDTTYQANASLNSAIVKTDGSIELLNSSGTKIKFNTREIIDDASGLSVVNGDFNLPAGNIYKINGTQIASSDLSDGSNLALLDTANTFLARQDFGQLGIDTDTILFSDANRSLQRIPPVAPATASQLTFRVLTGEEYKFNINTDEHLRIKASATEPSLFMIDNSSILGASTGFTAVASQAYVNASLQSQNAIDAITDTIENGGGLGYRHDGTTITPSNPANQLRILANPPTAPSFQLYYRNDRICEFNDNVEFKDNTKTATFSRPTTFNELVNLNGNVVVDATGTFTNNRVLTQEENIAIATTKEISRINAYTDTSSTTTNIIINYLAKIDRLFTDYRRSFNSIELFGDDSTGDPNDGTDDRWITGTGFMKEYRADGTLYNNTGTGPTYAEISVLKYSRNLTTSDTLHPNKYMAFIHNNETNSQWAINTPDLGGLYSCSINFNGHNRGAGRTQYDDYAFIGGTYTINASCMVNIVDNAHGTNDTAPDYIRLPTSGLHHANASSSTDENNLANITPSFYLKTGTATNWELVYRFPINGTYVYDTNTTFKKQTNVLVKFKQIDNWSVYTTDYTTNDYP